MPLGYEFNIIIIIIFFSFLWQKLGFFSWIEDKVIIS